MCPKALPMAEVILDDLVLEWFTIEAGAACIGKTIRDLQARTRDGRVHRFDDRSRTTSKRTNPEADTVLNEGATLIFAGDRRTSPRSKDF